MCGVAGVFHYGDQSRPVDSARLQRMTDMLRHRGPDDEGQFISGPVGLGHRRLTIVDLTQTGHQPMATADGQFHISFNGEFYNHRDFKPRLEAHGHRFRGTSDTETLLLALAQYGPRVLSDVAGIFSLALWDVAERRLILARDPLGVKQLYFHDDGRRIVFASEIKALFVYPDVPRELDPQALNEYIHFHTPLFERTLFAGIQQVRAGEYIEISANGVRRRTYSETDGFSPRHETPQAAVEELKELLVKVVGEQLMSDVPVGAFFSGGIDSSAIAAFARRAGTRVKCFGIHFPNSTVIDERPYQVAAAQALDVDLELTTVDGKTFPEDLLKLTWFQDQPIIGPAMIPMYYVSKLAARHVKVCLGGQGADEVFGGYARYALVHPARVLSLWFSRPKAAQQTVEAAAAAEVGGNLIEQLRDVRNIQRLLRRFNPGESWETRYFSNFADVPTSLWKSVFPDPALISRERARAEFAGVIRRSPAHDPGDRVLHWDIQTYLTGLFHQDDRMSMANSLESRVPMADPRLVRFALHTDFSLKLRGGASKWILRQALADVIPEAVLNRRKVGFDTPAEHWMRTTHSDFIRDLLLSSQAKDRGYWDSKQVEAMLDRRTSPYWFHVVWKLASLEAWARGFLDAPSAEPAPSERPYALA